MTEKNYIDTKELGVVLCAMSVLRNICPEISSVIPPEEFYNVTSLICKWKEDLFKVVKTKEE